MVNLNQLLNIGNESYAGDLETPKSLLDEMNEEIGFESDIDNAMFDAEATAVTSAASIVENVYVAFAEKECAVEGANPVEAYKGFGLDGALLAAVGQEALTDVVKRRAYSGLTQIKSLINTLIAWVAKILGLSANTKKIFKSLAEKAKKIRKELSNARSKFAAKNFKAGEEKEVTKEIVNYLGDDNLNGVFGLKTAVTVYGDVKKSLETITTAIKFENEELKTGSLIIEEAYKADKKEAYAEKIKTWKEETKNEVTGNKLFTEVSGGLDYLVTAKANNVDIAKTADKVKKHLEKVRKDLEAGNKVTANDKLSEDHGTINEWISNVSVLASFMNLFAKFYVKVADELFTDAKWLIMKAN